MNGKTHQISGVAATLGLTYFTIQAHDWLAATLPQWVLPVFTPPQILLTALEAHRLQSASTDPIANFALSPDEIAQITQSLGSTTQVVGLLAAIAFLGLIGGQLPDLDTPNAEISHFGQVLSRRIRLRGLLGLVLKMLFWFVNLIPLTTASIANLLFNEHRNGFIHGLVGLCIFSLGFGYLSTVVWATPFYGLLFFGAYATHLGVDSFSRSGVKWFWPLTDHWFHFLPKRICFYTANPLHNALAQSLSVGVIGWLSYKLILEVVTASNFLRDRLLELGDLTTTTPLTPPATPGNNQAIVITSSPANPTNAAEWVGPLIVGLCIVVLFGIISSALSEWPHYKLRQARGEI